MNNENARRFTAPHELRQRPQAIRWDILRGLTIVPADELASGPDSDMPAPSPGPCNDIAEVPVADVPTVKANTSKPAFDSLTAVGALSEALTSANEIVDILIRTGLPAHGKPSLWIQVAECEKRTADLLHRIALLRRKLFV